MLLAKLKHWLARYDAWCQELRLTSERNCCAYRPDLVHSIKPTDKNELNV